MTPGPGPVAGILLAAGESRRMGRPKALLPYAPGISFLAAVLNLLRRGGADPVLVVLGHDPENVRAAADLSGVRSIVHPGWQDGQFSSFRAGVAALPPGVAAAVVALVDQPDVPPGVVARLIAGFRAGGAPIVRPVRNGRGGHPILFSAETFEAVRTLSDGATMYDLVKLFRNRRRDVEAPDDSVLKDYDTPDAYRRGGFPRPAEDNEREDF